MLLEDLSYNATYLDTLIHYNDLILRATADLTNATLGTPVANDTLLADYMYRIQSPVIFLPQRTAYESLKSSGQLILISDLELRNNVIALHEYFYEGAGVYDQYLSDHVRDYIMPYFIENITYTSYNTIDNTFLRDAQFRKIIFQYKFSHEASSDFYKRIKSQTDKLIAELKARSS